MLVTQLTVVVRKDVQGGDLLDKMFGKKTASGNMSFIHTHKNKKNKQDIAGQ